MPEDLGLTENLISYKNRNGGIWGRGENHLFRNVKLADNAIGYTHAACSAGRDPYTSLVVNSLFVGETENIGNPVTPEEKAYGRSLPKRTIPDFPIRGYEYYDYRHDVVDTTFVNYKDNKQRRAGALSWLLFTSSGVTTTNTIKGAKFVNAKPVDFPNYKQEWDNDNRGGVAWRTATFHDLDGSVGGIPNAYVLIHDSENDNVTTDEKTCKIQKSWNAAVCPGDVGRLFLNKPGGTLAELSAGSPVTLHRNGKDHRITANQSNVRSGTEIRVKTERQELFLSLREMDQGSWVMFELPGFTKAASGKQQDSLDALRKASENSYFRDKDSLWVKLVITDADFQGAVVEPVGRLVAQSTIAVSR